MKKDIQIVADVMKGLKDTNEAFSSTARFCAGATAARVYVIDILCVKFIDAYPEFDADEFRKQCGGME